MSKKVKLLPIISLLLACVMILPSFAAGNTGCKRSAVPTVENITEPTCKKEGGYDEVYYCTDCGKELERKHKTVPALTSHISAFADRADADGKYTLTCADGEDRCIVCGEKLHDAVPHKYDSGKVIKGASLTKAGEKLLTCTVCGAQKKKAIPAGECEKGDADMDGAVTTEDARYICRAALGLSDAAAGVDLSAGTKAFTFADMDGSGKIQINDARLALRKSIGLDDD